MMFTLDFGKHDYTGNGIKDNLVEVVVHLEDRDALQRLSITGSIWNRLKTDILSGGQNLDSIRELVGFSHLMKRVHYIWQRYHLNDMKAGSPRQEAYLAGYRQAYRDNNDGCEMDSFDYITRLDLLEKAGLHPDTQHDNYRYGSSWLYAPIPDDVIAEIATWKEASA